MNRNDIKRMRWIRFCRVALKRVRRFTRRKAKNFNFSRLYAVRFVRVTFKRNRRALIGLWKKVSFKETLNKLLKAIEVVSVKGRPVIILTLFAAAALYIYSEIPFWDEDAEPELTEHSVDSEDETEDSISEEHIERRQHAANIRQYGIRTSNSREATAEEQELFAIQRMRYSDWNRRLALRSNLSSFATPEHELMLIDAARQAGFPESEILNVLKHSYCESVWDPLAYNNYLNGYIGVMQVASDHWNRYGYLVGTTNRREFELAMYDPYKNMLVSYQLYLDDVRHPAFRNVEPGYGPWKMTYGCRIRRSRHGVPWTEIITQYGNEPAATT